MPTAIDRGVDLGFEIIEPSCVRVGGAGASPVVHTLIDNALRHTPRGGRVDIGIYHEGARVILQIEDSGPGIPAAELERVFEPFVRGSLPAGEGTGLGLSIVRRIVERLRGLVGLVYLAESGPRVM